MDMRDLRRVFFTYLAIQVYLGLAAISIAAAAYLTAETSMAQAARIAVAVALTIGVYPLVWYLLHRYVLHGRYLYKRRQTAAVWKRIHFDHHQDPNDLRVLFGALHTTLPTIAIVTFSLGWAVGGASAAAIAFATGLLTTCFYEFCHCVQHLNSAPKSRFLQDIKRLHLAHHFHNETGNFGITNFLCDRVLGTYYAKAKDVPRSPTVFNIGYTEAEAQRYPWVQQLSNGVRRDGGPRPFGRPADMPAAAGTADGIRPNQA